MKRFERITWQVITGFMMVFFMVALVMSLCRWRPSFPDREGMWWLFGGTLCGSLLFYYFPLIPVYVLGHELTHWLIGKFFFRRTSKFRVGMNSGSVRVEDPNIWIILGPYIFPFYMLVFLVVFAVVARILPLLMSYRISRYSELVCSACIGILYAYHLILTVKALSQKQADLEINGWLYSMLFICLFNLFFMYLGIALVANDVRQAIIECWQSVCDEWKWIIFKTGIYW